MNISYSKTFVRGVEKLTKGQKDKMRDRIEIFKQNPNNPILRNHALRGKYKGYRSIDVAGDLRLLYLIAEGKVTFDLIGTHSQLYG